MTSGGRREQNIRLIVEMEDRIGGCHRCKSLLICNRKPSMGKGDLEPDIVLVFEYDSAITRNLEKILEIREVIKDCFKLNKIYHTFMVRCQPKACAVRHSTACYVENNKLIDRDNICMLTGKKCEGIAIKPGDPEVINCLPFLVEELEILGPEMVIMFGNRTSDFVLKAYGIFDASMPENCIYRSNDKVFISLNNPEEFSRQECEEIAEKLELI